MKHGLKTDLLKAEQAELQRFGRKIIQRKFTDFRKLPTNDHRGYWLHSYTRHWTVYLDRFTGLTLTSSTISSDVRSWTYWQIFSGHSQFRFRNFTQGVITCTQTGTMAMVEHVCHFDLILSRDFGLGCFVGSSEKLFGILLLLWWKIWCSKNGDRKAFF